MTHTNEFLRGMFSAYMGCEMAMMPKSTRGYYMRGLLYPERVEFEHKGTMDDFNIRCFKPILTPLSEITDEDAVEVVSIGGWSPQNQGKMLDCRFNFNSNEFIANFEFSRYRVVLDFHVIDYLRSKHYDCGYMHIPSLIAADLAISSKQI